MQQDRAPAWCPVPLAAAPSGPPVPPPLPLPRRSPAAGPGGAEGQRRHAQPRDHQALQHAGEAAGMHARRCRPGSCAGGGGVGLPACMPPSLTPRPLPLMPCRRCSCPTCTPMRMRWFSCWRVRSRGRRLRVERQQSALQQPPSHTRPHPACAPRCPPCRRGRLHPSCRRRPGLAAARPGARGCGADAPRCAPPPPALVCCALLCACVLRCIAPARAPARWLGGASRRWGRLRRWRRRPQPC